MRKRNAIAGILFLLIVTASWFPAKAGDVISGKVIEVKSADLVVLDYGHGTYNVRIAGISVPKGGPIATQAKQLVTTLVLGMTVRGRFEYRNKNGEMIAQLFVGDPGTDVGIELVKQGLARRQSNYDYKYREMSKAEDEARRSRRGLWK
jgi:endonuclease YncB( thermonuclease family)